MTPAPTPPQAAKWRGITRLDPASGRAALSFYLGDGSILRLSLARTDLDLIEVTLAERRTANHWTSRFREPDAVPQEGA